jgi:predicted  nucleic acid-binding Zn-ribbon protein
VNYEHRIAELEAEIEHTRRLQKIHRTQLDAHETWQEYTGSRMYEVEAALKHLTETVDRFIASLQKGNGHGHES